MSKICGFAVNKLVFVLVVLSAFFIGCSAVMNEVLKPNGKVELKPQVQEVTLETVIIETAKEITPETQFQVNSLNETSTAKTKVWKTSDMEPDQKEIENKEDFMKKYAVKMEEVEAMVESNQLLFWVGFSILAILLLLLFLKKRKEKRPEIINAMAVPIKVKRRYKPRKTGKKSG